MRRRRAGGIHGAALAALLLAGNSLNAADERLVDLDRSIVTIRVGGEGLLGAWMPVVTMRAPLSEGTFEEEARHLQVVFDARRVHVLDAGLSRADQAAIQARVLGHEVLDVARFPRVSYHSVTVDTNGGHWLVRGELELHGTILPVPATARRAGDRLQGTAAVSPRAFGITPVRRWFGLARTADRVTIDFDVVLLPPPPASRSAGGASRPARLQRQAVAGSP